MSISREMMRDNIQAFGKLKPELIENHKGKFALMRNGALVDVFPDKRAARAAAEEQFSDGNFAISPEIGAPPATLGAIGLYVSPVEV